MRFLVYRLGSLEIRATQESNRERSIGAVFSMDAPLPSRTQEKFTQRALDADELAKVTEYVEPAPSGKLHCRFYVVFSAKSGRQISTEQLSDGSIKWREGGDGLQVRNSLAKVMATSSCDGTVGDM